MAKALGFELTRGNMKKFISCAVEKEKQINIPTNIMHEPAKRFNGRVFLDISTIKAPK